MGVWMCISNSFGGKKMAGDGPFTEEHLLWHGRPANSGELASGPNGTASFHYCLPYGSMCLSSALNKESTLQAISHCSLSLRCCTLLKTRSVWPRR